LHTLPVRALALAASQGSTDFAGLFIALGFFLIAAAVGLAAMTMRLLIDRRAAEVGLLLAVGIAPRTMTAILLAEGVVLAAVGAVLGVPLGALYGWGVVQALTTWWAGAVADTPLWFHVEPASLGIGAVAGLVVSLPAAWWGVRALKRAQVTALLGGAQALGVLPGPPRGAWALWACVLVAAGSFAAGSGRLMSPLGAFFLGGTALLTAGLLGCGRLLARALTPGTPTFPRLALRNAAAQRGRSLLVIGLLACASFLLITVAASVRDFSRLDVTDPRSCAGGFTLMATSSLPILYDFGTASGRAKLGFATEDEPLFAGAQVYPFLVSPGDDVSCLNLAKSNAPRLLGVPEALRARGGFTVHTKTHAANPWTLLSSSEPAAFGDADSVEWSLHTGIGGLVPVEGTPVRIVGVLPGSIFANALLVSGATFRRLYPGISAPRYFLIATPVDKADAVATALRRTLGDLGLEVHPTREVLANYARVQNTYLSTFLALGGLGMLLGTLGLVVVLLRNALERRREFALLLAVGFSRGHLVRLLLLENAGLLVAGQLIGAVAALAAVVPQLAGAQIAWGGVITMLGGNLVLGLLATVIIAWPATRGRLLDGLRGE
jgi:ABC-type lipoprotein release transport system permease subunit